MSEAKPFPAATPVQFSPQLLETLDNSTESTISREQRRLQSAALVAGNKLDTILSEKRTALSNAINNASPSTDQAKDLIKGSPQLNQNLDQIADHLKNSAEAKIQKSPALLKAENDVTQCLLNNKGKPLKCWDEVQIFKKLAGIP